MKASIIGSLRFLLLSLLIFGGLYTVIITGLGQLLFSSQANGSQIKVDSQVVGSKLIGQNYQHPKYFSGRSQDVSQLAPNSDVQKKLMKERTERELKNNPSESKVPNDLVTSSASGVDPDISLEAADFQVHRIAKQRNIDQDIIRDIIEDNRQKDWFSDKVYVNVLQLNLALDKL